MRSGLTLDSGELVPAPHVQNPAEIEHIAGDVSKNGPESNMAQQSAPSAAAADPCPGCIPGGYCKTPKCGRLAVLNAAPQPSPTPQADSQPATDDNPHNVDRPNEVADYGHDNSVSAAYQTPYDCAKCGEHMGDTDLPKNVPLRKYAVCYKCQEATPQAASQPASVLDRSRIREIFMAHGFTVKEGQTDLKQYVYDAADALLRAARAPADSVTAPAATVIKKGADRQWMSERLGHLPDGIYSLYLSPPAQAADSVLEDAARELEYRRGYRHGYEQRDAEVRGALA